MSRIAPDTNARRGTRADRHPESPAPPTRRRPPNSSASCAAVLPRLHRGGGLDLPGRPRPLLADTAMLTGHFAARMREPCDLRASPRRHRRTRIRPISDGPIRSALRRPEGQSCTGRRHHHDRIGARPERAHRSGRGAVRPAGASPAAARPATGDATGVGEQLISAGTILDWRRITVLAIRSAQIRQRPRPGASGAHSCGGAARHGARAKRHRTTTGTATGPRAIRF
jgi:hypothetical protein